MKRCIFCKGNDLCLTSCGDDQYSVLCNDCGAEGPIAVDEKEAERLWDRINDYIDYHDVIKILNDLHPVKMGGCIAITESKLLDKLHWRIRDLKRKG